MRRFSGSQEDVIGEGTGPKFANGYRLCYLFTGGEITGAASRTVTMARVGFSRGGFSRVPRNTDTHTLAHTTVHKTDLCSQGQGAAGSPAVRLCASHLHAHASKQGERMVERLPE